MKIAFFLLALLCSLYSLNSFASRARLQALSNSYHLIDPQKIYSEVLNINYTPDSLILESGATLPTNATNYGEGLLVRSRDERSRVAVGIGHQPVSVATTRPFLNALAGTNYRLSQNPLYAVYGWNSADAAYAAGLYGSVYSDKVTEEKENSFGVLYGAEIGTFQFYFDYTINNSVQGAANRRFNGDGYFSGTANYFLDTITFYLNVQSYEVKAFTASVEDEYHRVRSITAGVVDSRKRNANDTFWGLQVVSTNAECRRQASVGCTSSASSVILPVWLGVEARAEDWLVFRGSVRQNVLIQQVKDQVGYPAGSLNGATGAVGNLSPGPNSTVVATGAGLQFNKFILDGTLSTSTTQILDATQLLSQVGVTYQF